MSVADCAPDTWCSRCRGWREDVAADKWIPARVASARARAIILAACEAGGVATKDLFGWASRPGRTAPALAAVRRTIARTLIADGVTGSQSQVARWLGLDPSSVNAMVHRRATGERRAALIAVAKEERHV